MPFEDEHQIQTRNAEQFLDGVVYADHTMTRRIKKKRKPTPPLFERAIQLHQTAIASKNTKALLDAKSLYQRILEADPNHPGALHFLGVLLHQSGDPDAAEASIRKALDLRPDDPDAWNNLGNVLKEAAKLQEAREAYETAIAFAPNHTNAHCNLGVVLAALGLRTEAVDVFQQALESDPYNVGVHYNFANVLRRLGRREEAVAHYRATLARAPKHPHARKLLALTLHHLGDTLQAVSVIEGWLALEPDHPEALHLLAACSGRDVPARASDAYVANTFDTLAASFDDHLAELQYRAPGLVRDVLAQRLGAPDASLRVLDAGCGTGLCAEFLRPYAKQLVGVDLSSGMLDRARRLGLYDDLILEELTGYLGRFTCAYDVVVSADTLCYFGDLGPVLGSAGNAMAPGAALVFTLERSDREGYTLSPHGRYSHSRDYVADAVAEAGMVLVGIDEAVLRLERGEPVEGLVVCAQRGGTPVDSCDTRSSQV